jgi:hypothetical protein
MLQLSPSLLPAIVIKTALSNCSFHVSAWRPCFLFVLIQQFRDPVLRHTCFLKENFDLYHNVLCVYASILLWMCPLWKCEQIGLFSQNWVRTMETRQPSFKGHKPLHILNTSNPTSSKPHVVLLFSPLFGLILQTVLRKACFKVKVYVYS